MAKRKITIEVDEDLLRDLKLVAVQRDLTVAAIIRGLIESWVTRQKAAA